MALYCSRSTISIIKSSNFKHDGIFVKIVFIQLEQKTNLKVRENKDFCNIVMSSEKTKTLEFNQYHKYDRTPFIIYTDLESLIKK